MFIVSLSLTHLSQLPLEVPLLLLEHLPKRNRLGQPTLQQRGLGSYEVPSFGSGGYFVVVGDGAFLPAVFFQELDQLQVELVERYPISGQCQGCFHIG